MTQLGQKMSSNFGLTSSFGNFGSIVQQVASQVRPFQTFSNLTLLMMQINHFLLLSNVRFEYSRLFQVSSQINQFDTGIQDVASNLEQAFKPPSQTSGHSVNTPTQDSNSNPDQNNSIGSSASSEANRNSSSSEKSKQRYKAETFFYQ